MPNGILYLIGEVPGFGAIGPAAFGFYDDAGVRTRVLSVARASEAEAKTAFATLKGKGKPVVGVGDEAVMLTLGTTSWVLARKGAKLFGAGDEEFAIKDGGAAQGSDALTAQVKKLLVLGS